jgi:peptide/nickel transport system substrate-binding protein
MVVGSTVDLDSWNEYLSRQAFAVSLHKRIWLRLAQEAERGADGLPRWEPLLAESWERSEDGRSLVFRLREVAWSDGTPLTSSDVRFTWKAQTAPDVAWVGAASKSRILDVVTPDPRTVVFRFERPYPEQLADAVDGGILPEHVHGRVPFDRWHAHDWSAVRVGSGPFLPASHRPGEEIVLERNAAYFQEGLPRLDRIVVRIVPDAANILTQFLAGRLDWVEGIPPKDVVRAREVEGSRIVALDTPGFDYVGWNGSRPPFDDPDIRRALGLATDARALVDELLYGFGRVSVGPVPSSSWAAPEGAAEPRHDPEQARRILARKGYGPDRPLSFEILTNAGNLLRESVVVKLQDQWARVGVRAVPLVLESRALRERAARGEFDAYLHGWRFAEKVDLAAVFGSGALPPAGANYVGYAPAEIDDLLETLRLAEDGATARSAYAAIARRVVEDQPYTFLYEPQRIVALGSRLAGAEIDIASDPLARVERFRLSPGAGAP